MNFLWHFKTGQNWRQILKIDRVDYYSISRATGFIPAGRQLLKDIKGLLPTLPFECPVLPKKYEASAIQKLDTKTWNMTTEEYQISKLNSKRMEPDELVTPTVIPNGEYRVTFHFFNDDDRVGFVVQFRYEIYYRLNAETF